MDNSAIKTVTIVGSGVMGSQIAMVSALAGYNVVVMDVNKKSLDKAKTSLRQRMDRQIEKGRFQQDKVNQAFNLMTFTSSIRVAMESTDFVIEAIVEDEDAKKSLFTKMDAIALPHVIFSTNSSTIVSSKLAEATDRPDKVCNMHFSNPALVMKLVELVKNEHTSDETAETIIELAKSFNKVPILLHKEISGFVMNRILASIMNEAIDLYEQGIASFEDIDLACTEGLNHPMGPFQLIDLTGLDVHYNVRQQRYLETGDENEKPSETVSQKLEKGELGKKSGKGFYTYA